MGKITQVVISTIFFILLNSLPLVALTLSEIRNEARYLVNDPSGTRQRFSDTQLNEWANEGQRQIDILSRCTVDAYTFDTIDETTYYAMPNDFITVKRVTSDNEPLNEMSVKALDAKSNAWKTTEGSPIHYFINFATRTKIGIYPYPTSSSDIEEITVEYYAYSDTLSGDSDVPFNSVKEFYGFHNLIVYYLAFKMSIIDENYKVSQMFQQTYYSLIQSFDAVCHDKPNYLPSFTPAGYGAARGVGESQ